jgi:hypothetical protein
MRPTQKLDFDQAVVEVSHAVDIAINVAKEGLSGSRDQLVDEVLKRIAEKTKANDPAGATREAEEGFALREAGRGAAGERPGLGRRPARGVAEDRSLTLRRCRGGGTGRKNRFSSARGGSEGLI